MKKTTMLRNLLQKGEMNFIMEAHNGLSARIVEEAGFSGIWASGLSISASQGMRDDNELSWTEVCDIWEKIADAVEIPVLVDADTGFGNYNSARLLVKKLEKIGIAGCCIEDKLFPKTNSFGKDGQELANVEEHCAKIKAMKDTQKDPDFVVVARLESFIAGIGLEDALHRAHRYVNAGADAVLVHSKKSTSADLDAFMHSWNQSEHANVPIVIVPTKYYAVPTDHFKSIGVNLVIWANHNVRASITAMQNVTKRIYEDQHLMNVEDNVATVSEIFRLQHDQELRNAEKMYLPGSNEQLNAVILAATQGSYFKGNDVPKTLLKIGNKSILETQIDLFHEFGVSHVSVVGGFNHNALKLPKVDSLFVNERWDSTNESGSLLRVPHDRIIPGTIISYGDIVFKKHVLYELLDTKEGDIVIIADTEVSENSEDMILTAGHGHESLISGVCDLVSFVSDPRYASANFIGLLKVNTALGASSIKSISNDMLTIGELLDTASKNENLNIKVRLIKGSWVNVETYHDLMEANKNASL